MSTYICFNAEGSGPDPHAFFGRTICLAGSSQAILSLPSIFVDLEIKVTSL